MLYHVTIGEHTMVVDLAGTGITIDGTPVSHAEMLTQSSGTLHHMIADGASHAVLGRAAGAGLWDLQIGGMKLTAEVVDERTRAIRAITRTSAGVIGPRPVKAPMPGLVVRVEVAVGDSVRAGQGVLIMEAMKMENELKADVAGVVSRIVAAEGQAVEKGAVLIEFAAGTEPADG
ncbi:MAG: biotin/lipoyl-containing protein [Longimicrobiales bacterium]